MLVLKTNEQHGHDIAVRILKEFPGAGPRELDKPHPGANRIDPSLSWNGGPPLPVGEVAVQHGLDRREHRALARGDVPLEGVPHNPPVAAVDDEIQLADRGHVMAGDRQDRAPDHMRLLKEAGRFRAMVAADQDVHPVHLLGDLLHLLIEQV
jgi:hypothetical protein